MVRAPPAAHRLQVQGGSAAVRAACLRCPGRAKIHAIPHRGTLNPATGGRVTGSQLGDRAAEFPTHNETLIGRPNCYRYAVSGDGIAKHGLTRATPVTLVELPCPVPAGLHGSRLPEPAHLS
jgi:hypothetical protein